MDWNPIKQLLIILNNPSDTAQPVHMAVKLERRHHKKIVRRRVNNMIIW